MCSQLCKRLSKTKSTFFSKLLKKKHPTLCLRGYCGRRAKQIRVEILRSGYEDIIRPVFLPLPNIIQQRALVPRETHPKLRTKLVCK